MESSGQIDNTNALLNADNDEEAEVQLSHEEEELEAKVDDVLEPKTMENRAKTIQEWSTRAFAVLHECLDDPGAEPRQPTMEDWNRYDFPSQEVVQSAVDYLVENRRILVVKGKYQMPKKTRFNTRLEKESRQFQSSDETGSSTLSASNMKYPFSHVRRYLRVKDESQRAPTRANADLVSPRERCEWIRDVLTANNFDVDYRYHPPCSWLDYYKIPLEEYQRHIPDTRGQKAKKKFRPPLVQSSSDSESEDVQSEEDYLSFGEAEIRPVLTLEKKVVLTDANPVITNPLPIEVSVVQTAVKQPSVFFPRPTRMNESRVGLPKITEGLTINLDACPSSSTAPMQPFPVYKKNYPPRDFEKEKMRERIEQMEREMQRMDAANKDEQRKRTLAEQKLERRDRDRTTTRIPEVIERADPVRGTEQQQRSIPRQVMISLLVLRILCRLQRTMKSLTRVFEQ